MGRCPVAAIENHKGLGNDQVDLTPLVPKLEDQRGQIVSDKKILRTGMPRGCRAVHIEILIDVCSQT